MISGHDQRRLGIVSHPLTKKRRATGRELRSLNNSLQARPERVSMFARQQAAGRTERVRYGCPHLYGDRGPPLSSLSTGAPAAAAAPSRSIRRPPQSSLE